MFTISGALTPKKSNSNNETKEIKSVEIKPDYFAKLPDALLQYPLFEVLGPQETAQTMVKSTTHHHHLFKTGLDKAPFPLIHRFIKHVAYGEQKEAETMLKGKDEKTLQCLLTQKMNVTDISGKKFINITAFQYALWALDWHMWKMIIKYLPKDKHKSQYDELEEKGVTYAKPAFGEHKEEIVTEKHYDFSLIRVLDNYVKNFSGKDWEQRGIIWCKDVGGAQKNAPAHIAQEYCHPNRLFDPTPEFKETTLSRAGFKFLWFSDSELGYKRAIVSDLEGVLRSTWVVPQEAARRDLAAMTALSKMRTQQLENLKKELLTQAATPSSFRY